MSSRNSLCGRCFASPGAGGMVSHWVGVFSISAETARLLSGAAGLIFTPSSSAVSTGTVTLFKNTFHQLRLPHCGQVHRPIPDMIILLSLSVGFPPLVLFLFCISFLSGVTSM